MNVLIVTRSDDNECVERVAEALERRGGSAWRLDTDLYPQEVSIRLRVDGERRVLELERGGNGLELDESCAIWHRRLAVARGLPESMEKQVRDASVKESQRVVHGLLQSHRGFVLDPWVRIRMAESKQLQLELARAVGLDVPRTLVTNDPADVRAFWDDCAGRVITKMMASFAIHEDGQEKVVFTNPLAEADLEALDGLRLCPMTFQEQLDKERELRVTVVGRRVFTAAVDSGALERSRTDWRREGLALIDRWKEDVLPPDVERALLALMDALGLNYGAADFVVTPDGRTVFLEVNPAGEFFWLDRMGLGISDAIAEVLLGQAPRREEPVLARDPRG